MSLFLDGPLPLEAITAFVQDIPLPSNNQLTAMFPTREFDTDEVDFTTITRTNRAAQYRSFDGNYWVAPRDTGSEKRIKLLPLGGTLAVGEYERRQIQFANVGGTIQNVLVNAIYNDAENLTRYTQNRLELAWGDTLADGVLTINENGVNQQLDYAVPADQKVTPATLWSNTATSTPLTDLLAWFDVWVAKNGDRPGRFKTSLEVLRLLQRNTQLINMIKGAQTGVTNVTLAEISGLFASYGLPPLSMEDSMYSSSFDVDGVTTRSLASSKFLFLPDDLSQLGFTAWGTPTTVMELNDKNIQLETAAGIIAILVREDNPPFKKQTFVDAVALPVLADPRKLLIATVTA